MQQHLTKCLNISIQKLNICENQNQNGTKLISACPKNLTEQSDDTNLL